MNKYEEFLELYKKERPMYEAWGKYIKEYIDQKLNLPRAEYCKMIKIPVAPRVKETASLVQKAFVRKQYTDPYNEITDKVGIRYVVMVAEQICIIEKIIQESEKWTYSKDQDFEEKRSENPNVFDYQSMHYVVKAINDIEYGGIIIKKGTPCEIQIRTLEQHAYAELSHDYIYKSNNDIMPQMLRNLAKSMALNETTDELFSKVYSMIETEKEEYYNLNRQLKEILTFFEYDEKLNRSIFEQLKVMISKYVDVSKIKDFITPFLDSIKENQDLVIYQQPIIIVIYFLAKNYSKELEETWDLPLDILQPVYDDLGISFDSSY